MTRDIEKVLNHSPARIHFQNIGNPKLWEQAELHEIGKNAVRYLDRYFLPDYRLEQFVPVADDKRIKVDTLFTAALFGPSRHITLEQGFDETGIHPPNSRQINSAYASMYSTLKSAAHLHNLQNGFSNIREQEEKLRKNPFRWYLSPRERKRIEDELDNSYKQVDAHSIPVRLLSAALDAADMHQDNFLYAPPEVRKMYARRILNFHGPLLRALNLESEADNLEKIALKITHKKSYAKTLAHAYPIIEPLQKDHELLDAAFREAITSHTMDPEAKISSRVKNLTTIHHKWNEPEDIETGEPSGKTKYKEVSDMPDLFGIKAVIPSVEENDLYTLKKKIEENLTGKTLSQLAPNTLQPHPDDTQEKREMKNRVGSLLLKHVGLRKDYVANPRETGYKALHVGVYLDNKSQHNPYTGLKNIEVQLTNELMKYTNNNEKAARDAYKGKHIKGIKAYTEEGTQTKTRPVFVKPPEGSIRLMHVDEEAKVIDLLHMLRGSPTTGVTDDDVLKNAYRVNSVEKGGQEHITLKLTDPIPIIAEAGHHLDVSLIKGKTRQLFNKNTFEAIKESANHVATKEWLHEMYKKLDLN